MCLLQVLSSSGVYKVDPFLGLISHRPSVLRMFALQRPLIKVPLNGVALMNEESRADVFRVVFY